MDKLMNASTSHAEFSHLNLDLRDTKCDPK